MRTFTFHELENIFEIGRTIQDLIDTGYIKYYESKEAFLNALSWAIEFEEKYKDVEDYYSSINVFVVNKCREIGLM